MENIPVQPVHIQAAEPRKPLDVFTPEKTSEEKLIIVHKIKPAEESSTVVLDDKHKFYSWVIPAYKFQYIVREFSVFFILLETCLLLIGYCVIFGAQLSIQYGYRLLTNGKDPEHQNCPHHQHYNNNLHNHHENNNYPIQEIEDDDNNNFQFAPNWQQVEVRPRGRMAGG